MSEYRRAARAVRLFRAFAGVLATLFAVIAGGAHAQTCTAVPPRVNSTVATLSGWTVSPGGSWTTNALGQPSAQHWNNQGAKDAVVPTSYDTLTANPSLTQVSGGAIIQLDIAWNNANRSAGGGATTWDGNQARLVVQFNDVIYASFYSSTSSNSTTSLAPGPFDGAHVVAENGATILSGTMPQPGNVSATPYVFNWATFRIQLPPTIASTSGAFVIGVQRVQTSSMPAGETDDFYVRNVSVNSRTVCVAKVSGDTGSTGSFGFTVGGLDTNNNTTVTDTTFSVTTTAVGTPVGVDGDSGVAGIQPMLTMGNGPVTFAETSSSNALVQLDSITCDNGVTGTRSGQTITLSALPANITVFSCTLKNMRKYANLILRKTWSGAIANDAVTVSATGFASNPTLASVANTANETDQSVPFKVLVSEAGTLGETFTTGLPANYSATLSCSGNATALAGSKLTVAAADTDKTITCTYVNSRNVPLTLTKASAVFSDPINGGTNPKAIPGAFVDYTLTINNPSAVATTADTVVVVDTLPARTSLFVNAVSPATGPVVFTPNGSGLTFTYTTPASTADDIDFSTDNGTTWTRTPVPDGTGVDAAITSIRVKPKGAMAPGSTATIRFRVYIK